MRITSVNNYSSNAQNFGYINTSTGKVIITETARNYKADKLDEYLRAVYKFIAKDFKGSEVKLLDVAKEDSHQLDIICGDDEICLAKFKNTDESEEYLRNNFASARSIDRFIETIDNKLTDFFEKK